MRPLDMPTISSLHARPVTRALRAAPLAAAVCLLLLASGSARAASGAPQASTGGSANVTYSSAVVNGSVNAHGLSTSYVFQYGTTRGYGAETPLAPAGSGLGSVHVRQAIAGLAPNTAYHYRILATNAAGATTGADATFRTPKVPLSLAIAGSPNPVPFAGAFLVEGTLAGTGAANHEIQLEANPFPYTGGFHTVGNPELTNASGGFSFPYLGLLENTQLRVSTVGSPKVVSGVLTEGVAVRVTLHVRGTRRHGFARLYGTVTPAEVGAQVGFQLLQPGRSHNEGGTIVTAGDTLTSRFSRVVRVRHRGLYEALVRVFDGAHVSAYSRPVLIR